MIRQLYSLQLIVRPPVTLLVLGSLDGNLESNWASRTFHRRGEACELPFVQAVASSRRLLINAGCTCIRHKDQPRNFLKLLG